MKRPKWPDLLISRIHSIFEPGELDVNEYE